MTTTRKERLERNRAAAAAEYAREAAKAARLLAQIEAGLAKHREAAQASALNYCHVGDLKDLTYRLQQLSDSLHGTGEYAD